MKHESKPLAYWRRLNEALVEAGEPQLPWNEAYDFYSSGLNREDALVRKLFGTEQSAPYDLDEAFNRTFGRA